MPRPQRCRRVCKEPVYNCFVPNDALGNDTVTLSIDEYEVIRLVDFEKRTHEQCAAQMDISRTTVTEIYESARYKVADSLLNGKRLIISGGNYRLCDGSALKCCGKLCRKQISRQEIYLENKGDTSMKIAVTYEKGQIFQHFGHTEQFKVYDVVDGRVIASEVVDTNGSGHGALAGVLKGLKVEALICGGIGGGARIALDEAGIKLYGGVSGNADDAVEALIAGNLAFNPGITCDHHGEHHSGNCGEHGCGSHHCGE